MAPTPPPAPTITRRLLCGLYEAVVLFGVVMMAGLLYGAVTEQRHALVGTTGLQAFLFGVLGIYFTWFWSLGRQTVAMKTWRMRLVTRDGRPLSQPRALARYVASWLWFLPALLAVWLADAHGGATIAWAVTAGIAGYALLARLTPSRQYLHDLICGTRFATAEPPAQPSGVGQNPAR